MTRSSRRLAALAGLLVAGLALAFVVSSAPPAGADAATKLDRTAFHDQMRKLWEDHIIWTRLFIVSAATLPDDLPDLGPTTDRLLANQADLGDAFRPFYGDAAGEAVTALLREHILGAARLLAAAKAGDKAEVQAASDAWYANGDEIAAALNGLNPRNWELGHMQVMMKAHLDRTLEEALARLNGDYAGDIAAYEKVHADILEMADMLSDGIVDQFPNRFVH